MSGSVSDGSRCQTRLNSQGCGVPSYHWCVPGTPSYTNLFPTASHVLPPSFERWMTCPNQPLDCDAYGRLGSPGDPLTWYISQPPKWGPLTSQRSRLPSAVRTNAPFRVPTRTRTLLMAAPLSHGPYDNRTRAGGQAVDRGGGRAVGPPRTWPRQRSTSLPPPVTRITRFITS